MVHPHFLDHLCVLLTLVDHARCGKLYKTDKIYDPPAGQFPVPASLNEPQLALRCNPALFPSYLVTMIQRALPLVPSS